MDNNVRKGQYGYLFLKMTLILNQEFQGVVGGGLTKWKFLWDAFPTLWFLRTKLMFYVEASTRALRILNLI